MEAALVDGLFARQAGPWDGRVLVFVHAFGDCGLSFSPLFDTALAREFRLTAPDLPGFGSSPRQDHIRTMADYAEAIVAFTRSLETTGPVGLVAHSVASMIAVEAAYRLGEMFGGLFSIEGNLTADDAYFSGRAADFDDPYKFKNQFLDDIWQMALTRPIFRRYFASATFAAPLAMWHLGCDARRLSVGDAPGRAYGAVRATTGRQRTRRKRAGTGSSARDWITANSRSRATGR